MMSFFGEMSGQLGVARSQTAFNTIAIATSETFKDQH
jgi:hypothetical protein